MTIQSFFIWLFAAFFYAYQYVLRVLPNVISSELVAKFNVDPSGFGQFLGMYYIGYTIAHLPIGIFLDKCGPKIVLPTCIIMVICGGITPLIFADHWVYCLIGRFLLGAGSVAGALGVFKISNTYFEGKGFARMSSIGIIIGLLGAMYGGLPLHVLFQDFGWTKSFVLIGVFGLSLALLLFALIPKEDKSDLSGANDNSIISGLLKILCNKDVTLLALFGGFLVAPLQGFADGWATTFLMEVYGLDSDVASLLPSTIFIGMCIGMFVLSLAPQSKYYDYMISCSVVMFVSFCILLSGYCEIISITSLLFIIGFASAYQILLTCKALMSVTQDMVGLTTALTNMIVMFFGYVFHTGISQIIGYYWSGLMVDGRPVYGPDLITNALMIIPVGLIIGGIGMAWLRHKASA